MRDLPSVLLRQFLAPIVRRIRPQESTLPAEYFTSYPSDQNALDIFEGEWYTSLPAEHSSLRAGTHDLWKDPRIVWALSELGSLEGKIVVELGPLEGAHTYMLQNAGCAGILAIEGNPRAYLKSLVLKEVLKLDRARFLCGDFVAYLRAAPSRADAVIASGVLYHMTNPLELLSLIAQASDSVFLWTHYYEKDAVARKQQVRRKFTGQISAECEGFRTTLFRYEYWSSFGLKRFYGGPKPYACWMERDAILECLRYFGFSSIVTGFDEPDHPDGPAFALVARRVS